MSLATIVLVALLAASVVLLLSFAGCGWHLRPLAPQGPQLYFMPGVSGIQSVEFVISNPDMMRRDRIVVGPGTIRRRMEPAPDPGPMFVYSSWFVQRPSGETVQWVGLEDLSTPTTGNFAIRCRAFTTPDGTGMPVADTDTQMPAANFRVTRRTVDGRLDRVPNPSFRLLPDFPALPGEPPAGATPEIRAGQPTLPPLTGNARFNLDVNPALFGSRPPSANFTITPPDGTPRTVTVGPGIASSVPAALGSGTAEYIESDVHITYWLLVTPSSAGDWTVTVSANRITSAPATVHVDPDPERFANVEFRAHPWDGESGAPTIGVEWTQSA